MVGWLIGWLVGLRLKSLDELGSWMTVSPVLHIQRKISRMSNNHSDLTVCMNSYINVQLVYIRIWIYLGCGFRLPKNPRNPCCDLIITRQKENAEIYFVA